MRMLLLERYGHDPVLPLLRLFAQMKVARFLILIFLQFRDNSIYLVQFLLLYLTLQSRVRLCLIASGVPKSTKSLGKKMLPLSKFKICCSILDVTLSIQSNYVTKIPKVCEKMQKNKEWYNAVPYPKQLAAKHISLSSHSLLLIITLHTQV